MTIWIVFALLAILSYFIGNISNAILISKIKKKDIRTLGSGNPGTLNMSRNFGMKIGFLTLFLDAVKGALPALIGHLVFLGKNIPNVNFEMSDLARYAFALCAVLGHIYPVLYKFKGGKGIATTIGALMISSFCAGWGWGAVSVMAFVAAFAFIYFAEYGAMGSFIAITPPAIANSIFLFLKYAGEPGIIAQDVVYMIACAIIALICFFTWLAHRKNIERMLRGEEHVTSIKKMIFNHKQKKALSQKENNIKSNDLL